MLEGFKNFFADPTGGADSQRSAIDIFLLIGFVLVCILVWRLILGHILAELD